MAAVTRPEPALLRALIRAATLPGVGSGTLAGALEGAEAEERVRRLETLITVAGSRRDANVLERARGWAVRALETVAGDALHVLVPGVTAYPAALLALDRPPVPLFARGRLDLLDPPTVAVVGTRSMTAYGREAARRIAGGLAAAGVTVISGLARGVDGVAHRAAGVHRTVAVVGCGLDVAFPREHTELQAAIGRQGLVLSEQLPGTPPVRHNFPLRNRLIAALARAVVVVEAPPRSGALSTAARARELGKDVFAVPGPVGVRTSEGTNALIRDGATLVTGPREVLASLDLLPAEDWEADQTPADLEGQALALWRALDHEPRHVDDVASRAGLDPKHGLASLLSLELQGHARQLSGLRFERA